MHLVLIFKEMSQSSTSTEEWLLKVRRDTISSMIQHSGLNEYIMLAKGDDCRRTTQIDLIEKYCNSFPAGHSYGQKK